MCSINDCYSFPFVLFLSVHLDYKGQAWPPRTMKFWFCTSHDCHFLNISHCQLYTVLKMQFVSKPNLSGLIFDNSKKNFKHEFFFLNQLTEGVPGVAQDFKDFCLEKSNFKMKLPTDSYVSTYFFRFSVHEMCFFSFNL